ncbi:hypothetical protein AMELA_G00294560 [Ameiurus melas]|uniref:Uncharacterized protein n=1 Tax=Ameiurus melas TaxID=219545 RepID=A0A7J5ZHV6_AMEME|nr:hypothetical protein AMELA_G00294560 [Ameiurus melas]
MEVIPSIHLLPLTPCSWSRGNLEPIPGCTGHKAEYTLDKVPVHRQAFLSSGIMERKNHTIKNRLPNVPSLRIPPAIGFTF